MVSRGQEPRTVTAHWGSGRDGRKTDKNKQKADKRRTFKKEGSWRGGGALEMEVRIPLRQEVTAHHFTLGKGHRNLSIPSCRASAERRVKGLRKGFPGRRGVLEMQLW